MQAGELEKNVNFCSSFQVGFEGTSKLLLVFVKQSTEWERERALSNLKTSRWSSVKQSQQLQQRPGNCHYLLKTFTKKNSEKIASDDDLMNSNFPPIMSDRYTPCHQCVFCAWCGREGSCPLFHLIGAVIAPFSCVNVTLWGCDGWFV